MERSEIRDGTAPHCATLHAGYKLCPMPSRSALSDALKRLAPLIPKHEFGAIIDHALDSPGLRAASPETAAWLSLVAYVRHALTEYDDLLRQGYDKDSARFFVADAMRETLEAWGVRRPLNAED